jgi:hypothetical protein
MDIASEVENLSTEIQNLRQVNAFESWELQRRLPGFCFRPFTAHPISLLHRNLLLWQLSEPQTIPNSVPTVYHARDIVKNVTKVLNLRESCCPKSPKDLDILPLIQSFEAVLGADPFLFSYFVNVGFASLFEYFITPESIEQAAHFFTGYLSSQFTPLIQGAIGNFTLHSYRFLRQLRSTFLRLLLNAAPDDRAPVFKIAIVESLPYMTKHHIAVWRAAFTKSPPDALNCFVNNFLRPLLNFWRAFPDFVNTPFLASIDLAELSQDTALAQKLIRALKKG